MSRLMTRQHPRLEPFRPGRDGVFGLKEAARLHRRFAFGRRADGLRADVSAGLDACLDAIFSEADEDSPDSARYRKLVAMGPQVARSGNLEVLQAQWFARCVSAPRALGERLAFFWHDHFATGADKVKDLSAMEAQNALFRRLGGGRFPTLLAAASRDPAMLVWLDNATSDKRHPNENFARELLELFCLGIGNYGERDVVECARAFTGWRLHRGRFCFDRGAHDPGLKSILGHEGRFSGDDVLQILAADPRCARFIATGLYREFVADVVEDDLGSALGQVLVAHDFAIRPFLRELAASKAFFEAGFRIAAPVELLIGAMRSLDAGHSASRLVHHARKLGQEPYRPPDVAGWRGGRAWINSSTLIARRNFAAEVGAGEDGPLSLRLADDWQADEECLTAALTGRAPLGEGPRPRSSRKPELAAAQVLDRPEAWLI
ncbi:MAG: DUF1800 domain-containing protein [Planctomycetes bacterium]|nr:DUF1800 domain-containing protein [Planctomycetota bacterium]